ncbi:hypothetical protein ACSZNY_19635, partial [Aeromonas caviae]
SGPFIEADDMELTNMDSLLLDGSLKAVREAAEPDHAIAIGAGGTGSGCPLPGRRQGIGHPCLLR